MSLSSRWVLFAWAVAALFGVTACDSAIPAGRPQPPFDFGAVPEGRRKRMSIRLENKSVDDEYRIGSVSVETTNPAGGSDFWLASNGCAEILEPDDSCVVEVIFEPAGRGTRSGRLTIEATPDGYARGLAGDGVESAQRSESAQPGDTTESIDEEVESADPSESAEPGETTETSGPSPDATAE